MRPISVSKPARLTKRVTMALLLVGAAAPSQAGQISLDPTFNISDQSIWGTAAPSSLTYSQNLRVRAGGNHPRRPYRFDASVFGAGVALHGHIDVDHNFIAKGDMTAGSLDATLPYDIDLSFNQRATATGYQIEFGSSYSLDPNASFSTHTGLRDLKFQEERSYQLNVNLEACSGFSCRNLVDTIESYAELNSSGNLLRTSLFEVEAGSITVEPPENVSGLGRTFDSLTFNPAIKVDGSVSGNSVFGGNEQDIVKLDNFKPLKLVPVLGALSTGGFDIKDPFFNGFIPLTQV